MRAPKGTISPTCQPDALAAVGRGDHLVRARRICHSALGHGHAVLGVVLAAHAADRRTRVVVDSGSQGLPVRAERDDEKVRGAGDSFHERQVSEALGEILVAEAGEGGGVVGLDAQVGRVRGGQVGGEGRLRAASTCHRAQSDATDKPDKEDQSDVTAPPSVQGRTEAVPRDAKCAAHGRASPRCSPHLTPLAVYQVLWLHHVSMRIESRGGQPADMASC